MCKKSHFLTVFVLLLSFGTLIAQSKTISGIISDAAGVPLPGATVLLKGTTTGTSTDFNGSYAISVPEDGVLVYSMMGFKSQEISVTGQSTINITLQEDVSALDEVVVTAFGFERKTRSLAYATAEVQGEDFVEARAINLGNALSGKVAGVVVSNPATGPGGTSRVVIRGGSTLTGNDQPLYVVNGVPINNDNQGAAGTWGGNDGGDGLSTLNPDDIENISVLKGNTASALYGSLGANGVILITTKSGTARKGLGVTFNSNLLVDRAIDHTDFQKQYGNGINNLKPTNQTAATDYGVLSWGAPLDGSQVVQFDGVQRPYSDLGEGINDFFNTGFTLTNTLGLSGGNENHTYRFSLSNLSNEGVVPNSGFDKNMLTLNINGKYGRLSSQVSATFSKEVRLNSPRVSDTPGNINFGVYTKPANISFDTMRGVTDKLGANQDGTELMHQGNPFAQNPYWAAYQWLREDDQNRLFGNASLKYDFTDWLYVQGRFGTDVTNSKFTSSEAYGTAFKPLGDYNIFNDRIREDNYDLFIGINKEFGDFGMDVLLGGNMNRTSFERARIGGNDLSIPFFHSINNVTNQTYTYEFRSAGRNSVFAQANISYKDYLYFNISGRQDTFSTLNPDDNSVFYPSVGLSFVMSEVIDLPSIFNYLKLRTAVAGTGGSEGSNPYQLNQTYAIDGVGHNGATLGRINGDFLPNASLTTYLSSEIEAGFETRLLNNRLSLDFTYYSRKSEDLILPISVSRTSGFSSTNINVGQLTNKGVELMISGTPVKNQNFQWDASFNMANNISEAIDLGTDAEGNAIDFLNREDARTLQERIRHVVGRPLGLIYGFEHKTIDGQKVYTSEGLPVRGDFVELGQGVHPFSAGLNNSFRYKDFFMNFLIDIRSGGSLYSGTNVILYSTGQHKGTLPGRENGLTVTGVDDNGNPLTVNIAADDVRAYYNAYNDITANFVYDASFAKLRELTIGYKFPSSLLQKTFFESASVSLTGRNLWLLWSSVPNVDPESGYSSNAGAQGLEYFSAPVTSSLGINISVGF